MSARRDPVTGDFLRNEAGKIKRHAPRYRKCRVCGARHHQDLPTKACLDKARSEAIREGSLRFTREDGTINIAEPGSMWFSTLTMVAQEVYLGGEWVNLNDD